MSNYREKTREYHENAMAYVDKGLECRRQGYYEQYRVFINVAFWLESIAANLALEEYVEPTCSVLHRSAASLAIECGQVDHAIKLTLEALDLNSPPEIKLELWDSLKEIVNNVKY